MAYTDYIDTVQKMYIGYYQRPADLGGLIYWAQRLDAQAGNLQEIIEAFAASAEAQLLHGPINSSTIGDVVTSIYNALFDRDPEPEGLAYYVDGFNAGQFTAATIMLNILNGAQGEDLLSVNNKLTAANLFTETIDPELDRANYQVTYSGNLDAYFAQTFLSTVTSDSATLPTNAETNAFMKIYIADPGDPILTQPNGVAYPVYFGIAQKVFIAYYARPADPQTLIYWANELAEGRPIPPDDQRILVIDDDPYGPINSSTIGDVVTSIYNALFDRDPEPEGLAYYVDGFNAGQFTAATIMLNILNGAQGEDLLSVNNKLTAANLFTLAIDPELDLINIQATYSGDADAQYARAFLSQVGSNPSTIPTYAETMAYIQDNIADSGDPILSEITGQTFTLTTGIDNIVSTTFYDLNADSVNAFILTGDGNIKFTTLTNRSTLTLTDDTSIKFTTLTDGVDIPIKMNASNSSGNINLDASAFNTATIAYIGSSGIDTYKATDGGSIKGGAGNDQIILKAHHTGGKSDTIIYTSGLDVSFKDANLDGKIDNGNIETITNFITTSIAAKSPEQSDMIDLSSFGFSGYAKGTVDKGTLTNSVESGNFPFTITNFFADAGGNRGAAFGTFGTDTYVFVDVDKDSSFDASKDLAIKLVGVTDFSAVDIHFA